MGKIIVKVKIANLADEILIGKGLLVGPPRQVEVEALVDTGATGLHLQPAVIQALGLKPVKRIVARTANGSVERTRFSPVRLELMGRDGNFDVIGLGSDVPNLLGQVPLEVLDFVVDPRTQTLIGNPEHDGRWMHEEYCACR